MLSYKQTSSPVIFIADKSLKILRGEYIDDSTGSTGDGLHVRGQAGDHLNVAHHLTFFHCTQRDGSEVEFGFCTMYLRRCSYFRCTRTSR